MKRKEVRKVLRENPEFAAWIREDSARLAEFRANPRDVSKLLNRWKQTTVRRHSPALDYAEISRKTKRASDVLGKVQNFMNSIVEYANEQEQNK